MHNGERAKVVGAINYYKINDGVYDHYNCEIYKMLFIEELKPKYLNLQSKSILVCNTCLFFILFIFLNTCLYMSPTP